MRDVVRDLRYAIRGFARTPGFTLIVLASIALGVGTNTAIFSLANTILLRPPHVYEPGSLVNLHTSGPGGNPSAFFSYPTYLTLRDGSQVFNGLAAFAYARVDARTPNGSRRMVGAVVTGNYFDTLGVRPAVGRAFAPGEDHTPGAQPVVVISHQLWRNEFGANAAIVGTPIVLNGGEFRVIGVTPEHFSGTVVGFAPDFWVPTMMQAQFILPPWAVRRASGSNDLIRNDSSWLYVLGRLNSGLNAAAAQAELAGTVGRGTGRTIQVVPLPQNGLPLQFQGAVTDLLALLGAATGLVLLISCVNVAGLFLQRAAVNRPELAIRAAVGATRAKLVRQSLVESLTLSAAGGALGVLASSWTTSALTRLQSLAPVPVTLDLGVDHRVLAFAAAVSVAAGAAFSLPAAYFASRFDSTPLEHASKHAQSRRFGSHRFMHVLVALQIAIAVVLLTWTGLVVRGLQRAAAIDLGFERSALLVPLDLEFHAGSEGDSRAFLDEVLRRVSEAGGVKVASLTMAVPLAAWERSTLLDYDPRVAANRSVQVSFNIVAPRYFEAMGIPLLRGRDFGPQDHPAGTKVTIINEALVRLGSRLKQWKDDAIGRPFGDATVIGVVADSKVRRLDESAQPVQYLPASQHYSPRMTLVVQPRGEPGPAIVAARQVVAQLNPNMPLNAVASIGDHLGVALAPARAVAILVGLLGTIALVVALVGIYGVSSYAVTQRLHEFGVRSALGATPAHLYSLVMRRQAVIIAVGVAAGVALSVTSQRLVSTVLYGTSSTDYITYGAIGLSVAFLSTLPSLTTARVASRTDAVTVLKRV